MNKTTIEWCDYTINPVKGLCPVACSYCYARRMYKRFKWNPEIRLDVNCFLPLLTTIKRKPSRIFLGSTFELFGDFVKPEWMRFIFERIQMLPEHIFIFLTKRPENLPKKFPDNCWVGVSVCANGDMTKALTNLAGMKSKVKFLSIEPLLGQIGMDDHMPLRTAGISWVIIGAQSPYSEKTAPKKAWIDEIEDACRKASIPFFEKNNLKSLLGRDLIQQFPRGVDFDG